jgi:serine/threonine-protein kinase
MAIAAGVAATFRIARSPSPAPAASAVATAAAYLPAASAPEDAKDTVRHVTLVVFPEDAAVEVDGARAKVQDGAVEVTGPLGSEHRVRVWKGASQVEATVLVTEKGAAPPKVSLPRREVTTTARPAGAATRPPPGEARGSVATSPPAVDDDLMRKPE